MALTNRQFYAVLGLQVSHSPSTGYQFSSGNSGDNFIQSLQRVQTVNDSFSVARQNLGQLGQLSILTKLITEPPTVPLETSYYVADLSNERKLGFYVSGDQSCLTNILNLSEADKNYFIVIAPPGIDAIGWTGNYQTKYVTNGYLTSWSTEGAVGGIPTTTVGVQGFNWATDTGSTARPLYGIDFANNALTTGVLFTLPTLSSGIANTVAAIRPSEITATFGSGVGLDMSDVKLQRYNISFNLNLENLNKLGSFFPYSKVPKFPVDVTASLTAYWGNLITGSLSNLLCNDVESTVSVTLRQPACLGQSAGAVAAQFTLLGAKLDSQSNTESYQDVASTVTLNFTSTIGGPNDTVHNFLMSGIN